MAATRWRARVETGLEASGLTFLEWLVLDATAVLIQETGGAVNQSGVAAHLGLHRMTVSLAMRALADRALVDRGPAMTLPAWRIFVTRKALELLRYTSH